MRQLKTGTFLAFAMVIPALAQAPSTSGTGQSPAPSSNSGAGIPGQSGNKSGPAAKPPGSTGAVSSDQDSATRNQDASNIPGQPGARAAPPWRPPRLHSPSSFGVELGCRVRPFSDI
jgi:hypothetical protein